MDTSSSKEKTTRGNGITAAYQFNKIKKINKTMDKVRVHYERW